MQTNKKIIVIAGPTCTSKNTLAMQIARKFNGEIVNADAFQVYKQINVGVNKPSRINKKEIKHHLVSFLNYNEPWDIALFQEQFDNIYNEIVSRNKVPILCGGSHMYIDAIVSGYNLTKYNLDLEIEQLNSSKTNKELFDYILSNDPEYASKISINNRRRLLRVVAIMQKEHQSMTNLNKRNKPKYNPFLIVCNKPRELIYEAINKRVDEMLLDNKWEEEVKLLISQYNNIENTQCFKAIGYKEILESIKNQTPIDVELIKKKTRNYAKRQQTWCNNKFANKIIYDWEKPISIELMIKEFLKND